MELGCALVTPCFLVSHGKSCLLVTREMYFVQLYNWKKRAQYYNLIELNITFYLPEYSSALSQQELLRHIAVRSLSRRRGSAEFSPPAQWARLLLTVPRSYHGLKQPSEEKTHGVMWVRTSEQQQQHVCVLIQVWEMRPGLTLCHAPSLYFSSLLILTRLSAALKVYTSFPCARKRAMKLSSWSSATYKIRPKDE